MNAPPRGISTRADDELDLVALAQLRRGVPGADIGRAAGRTPGWASTMRSRVMAADALASGLPIDALRADYYHGEARS